MRKLREESDAKHISDETAYKFVDLRDVKSAIADIAEDIIYEIKERIEDGEEEIDVNDVANNVEESYFDTDKEMHIMIAGKMARDMSEDEVIEVLKEADPEFEGIFEGDGEDESGSLDAQVACGLLRRRALDLGHQKRAGSQVPHQGHRHLRTDGDVRPRRGRRM